MSRRRHILTKGLKAAAAIVGLFIVADLAFPVHREIPYARMVLARDSTILYASTARDGQWRMKAMPEEITPELKKTIIFKEDRYFYYHFGVNPVSVVRAMVRNTFTGRRTSGASTITMQVARLLEPRRRTYASKVIEMFRATQLEVHHSKEEVLRMYLDLVPYGSNIQGVKAASLLYLGKMPDHLSLAEVTALSVIPNRPNSLVPGINNPGIMRERDRWLHNFAAARLFPNAVIRDALQEPFTGSRRNAPQLAPQLAHRLQQAQPFADVILSTVDARMQKQAQLIAHNYMSQLQLQNIHNAAVLVVDNETRNVVAYVGSSDFTDSLHHGEVDGITALRSPGSTLKPFLYGLCMDRGMITPQTVVADVPVNIKGYSPENYDREFRGNVTIEYALSHSLNIPAVRLLDAHGLDAFLHSMAGAGFAAVAKSSKDLGMSVILGGCSVRLDELTGLYAAFANSGWYRPLQFCPVTSGAPSVDSSIVSPAACYLLSDVLCKLQRPDLPNSWQAARNVPKVAWKTGTSYGRKDAWSVGYNKRYTIGVWVGNFSAEGVQELSGINTATPLLFQLFNALDKNASEDWLQQPATVGTRLVCTETGMVPEEWCTNTTAELFVPGVSGSEKCTHLKQVWTDPKQTMCYCSTCLPAAGYKTVLMRNVAPEIATWYEASHIAYDKTPPHNPACGHSSEGVAPRITSLTNGMTYLIENREQQKLQLSCAAAGDVSTVYWYVNDKLYARAAASEKLLFSADASDIKISCVDDKGRNEHIRIKVKFI